MKIYFNSALPAPPHLFPAARTRRVHPSCRTVPGDLNYVTVSGSEPSKIMGWDFLPGV